MDKDLIAKARKAQSAQELRSLAAENGTELTAEQAEEVFGRLHSSGELTDDELDAAAGGGCHKKDGRLIVTVGYKCLNFKCKACGTECTGQHMLNFGHNCRGNSGKVVGCFCGLCSHMSYEGGLWLCNHPANIS